MVDLMKLLWIMCFFLTCSTQLQGMDLGGLLDMIISATPLIHSLDILHVCIQLDESQRNPQILQVIINDHELRNFLENISHHDMQRLQQNLDRGILNKFTGNIADLPLKYALLSYNRPDHGPEHIQIIKMLLDAGASVAGTHNPLGLVPAIKGPPAHAREIAKLLLSRGACIDGVKITEDGMTYFANNPLGNSLIKKQFELAEFFIENKADIFCL